MAFTPDTTPTPSPGAIQGRPYRRPAPAARRLNLPPTAPFIYKAHPTRWALMGGQWRPQLAKLKLEPGVNGITSKLGEGQARENARLAGWVVLDPEVIGEDYVQVIDGARGPVHLEKWVTVKQVGNQTILKPDTQAFYAFLDRLIDNGHVAPLDEDIREAIIEQRRARVLRNQGKAQTDPVVAARRDADQALVDAMEAADE